MPTTNNAFIVQVSSNLLNVSIRCVCVLCSACVVRCPLANLAIEAWAGDCGLSWQWGLWAGPVRPWLGCSVLPVTVRRKQRSSSDTASQCCQDDTRASESQCLVFTVTGASALLSTLTIKFSPAPAVAVRWHNTCEQLIFYQGEDWITASAQCIPRISTTSAAALLSTAYFRLAHSQFEKGQSSSVIKPG